MKVWIEVTKFATRFWVEVVSREWNEGAHIKDFKTKRGALALANRWAVRLGGENPKTGKVEPLAVKDLTGGE